MLCQNAIRKGAAPRGGTLAPAGSAGSAGSVGDRPAGGKANGGGSTLSWVEGGGRMVPGFNDTEHTPGRAAARRRVAQRSCIIPNGGV